MWRLSMTIFAKRFHSYSQKRSRVPVTKGQQVT